MNCTRKREMTMQSLTAQELVHLWEFGLRQHPVDRAISILAMALPETLRDALPELSIGQRDAYLLALREQTLGQRLSGFAECPECKERLEFIFDVASICAGSLPENTQQMMRRMMCEQYELHFRLPSSRDLAAIALYDDVGSALQLLLQRCVAEVYKDGVLATIEDLPEFVIGALEERMLECDPQAEVQLHLTCPACGHDWAALFDIVSFFWSEICTQAKRLLREVHTLANAYGWHEVDILSMSTARRQFYLEMVTA